MWLIPALFCLPVCFSDAYLFLMTWTDAGKHIRLGRCTQCSLSLSLSLWTFSGCQRRNGVLLDTSMLTRLSHKRLMATFQVEAQRGEQDLYRCITLSPRGAAVSNFGELIVRGKL